MTTKDGTPTNVTHRAEAAPMAAPDEHRQGNGDPRRRAIVDDELSHQHGGHAIDSGDRQIDFPNQENKHDADRHNPRNGRLQ